MKEITHHKGQGRRSPYITEPLASVCAEENGENFSRLRSLGWGWVSIERLWGLKKGHLRYRAGKRGWTHEAVLPLPLLRFVERSLFGDGSICWNYNKAKAYFDVSVKEEEYVLWLKGVLDGFGVKSAIYTTTRSAEKWGYKRDTWIHSLRTTALRGLVPLREKWYPEGSKLDPLDYEWDLETVERFIAEDGAPAGPGSRLYWGVKSDEGFERLLTFLHGHVRCWESFVDHTAGRTIYIADTSVFRALPGYRRKFPRSVPMLEEK